MKYNWHIFFKRLTIVISILTILITGIYVTVEHGSDVENLHPILTFFLAAGTMGVPFAIGQWIMFFLIRWIVRGLRK